MVFKYTALVQSGAGTKRVPVEYREVRMQRMHYVNVKRYTIRAHYGSLIWSLNDVKITAVWDATTYRKVQSFKKNMLPPYPEDSSSRLVRSHIIFLPDYTEPHHVLRP
jgi:hypothetical protein